MRRKTALKLITFLDQNQAPGAPLTVRLQNAIRRLIAEGHVREGDRLPSSRLLASEAKLARDTVESAYQQLEAEGYIERRLGSGSFVAAIEPGLLASPRKPYISPKPEAVLSRRGKEIAQSGGAPDHRDAHPFVILPDIQQFPLETWRKLTARVLADHRQASAREALLYAEPMGRADLRQEIAAYLAAHRGVQCTADRIVVLNSSQQALGLIATLLLDAGDSLAMEEPGFHGARLAFRNAGLNLAPVPVDAEGLIGDALPSAALEARAVYVTPSHQYPTGATLSLERRLGLIRWAEATNGWIIEDDYDSEYRYDSRPIAAIQGLDHAGRVLYLGTFSKVLFPGIRLAYIVLPESLVPAFVAGRTLIDGHTAPIAQAVLAAFMREGHFTAYIRRMRELYRARRDNFLEAFDRHLSPFADPVHPAGGLHMAAYLREGLDEAETVRIAAAAGIELPTLSRLYLGKQKRAGWLLGFAALDPHRAESAMRQLSHALSRQAGAEHGRRRQQRNA